VTKARARAPNRIIQQVKQIRLEDPVQGGTLNHLGVEVENTVAVDAEQTRLAEQAWPSSTSATRPAATRSRTGSGCKTPQCHAVTRGQVAGSHRREAARPHRREAASVHPPRAGRRTVPECVRVCWPAGVGDLGSKNVRSCGRPVKKF